MGGEAERRERVALISVEAERLVDVGAGPSALVDGLVLDGAADLAALAAERHFHATTTRLAEEHRAALAERSPVFLLDQRTLIAAPVGRLEEEGLARFCDRVLAEAAAARPARVVLALRGLDRHAGADAALAALGRELAAHGIDVEPR
jgi:hypothetical protein